MRSFFCIPESNEWCGLLFVAAAAATAFKILRADEVAEEVLLVELTIDLWFLSNARWLGDWFSWFNTSATLKINKKKQIKLKL